VTATTIVDF